MKNEIKETITRMASYTIHYDCCSEGDAEEDIDKLLDYITNLQEELEDLREDNYAYHQLMKMQNKREYRSKFLKEFQEEYGTNVFPDYDEIYKRYDKMKKRVEYLERSNNRREDTILEQRQEINDLEDKMQKTIQFNECRIKEWVDYRDRINKAIGYNNHLIRDAKYHLNLGHLKKLNKILQGEDKNEDS